MEERRIRSRRTVHETEWAPGHVAHLLVDREEYSVKLERIPPGGASALHVHQHSRQFLFVLEGEARIQVGGEVCTLSMHEGAEIAAGEAHRIEHASGDTLVFLLVSVPRIHPEEVWPK